jgi:hypothetical protein
LHVELLEPRNLLAAPVTTGVLTAPLAAPVGAAPAILLRIAANVPLPPPLLPAPSAPAAGQGNPDVVPRSVLVALGMGPLGGLPDPDGAVSRVPALPGTAVLDRVVAEAPRFLRGEEVLRLVALLPIFSPVVDNAGENAAEQEPAVEMSGPFWLPRGWGQAGEFLIPWLTPVEKQTTTAPKTALPREDTLAEPRQDVVEEAPEQFPPALLALAVCGVFAGMNLEPKRNCEA